MVAFFAASHHRVHFGETVLLHELFLTVSNLILSDDENDLIHKRTVLECPEGIIEHGLATQ